jgi:hypothetical protein
LHPAEESPSSFCRPHLPAAVQGFKHSDSGPFKKPKQDESAQQEELKQLHHQIKTLKIDMEDGGGGDLLGEEEEDSCSVFSISENIKMMLLEGSAAQKILGGNTT